STNSGSFAVGVGRLADDPERYLFVLMATSVEGAPQIEASARGVPRVEPASDVQPAPNAQGAEPEGSETEVDTRAVGTSTTQNWSPDDLKTSPIRFVWKTDRNGVFIDISDEFATAVGPASANVIGHAFDDVADRFNLDPQGDIAASLQRRDTWSGKSVLWPVQDTDLRVPVDLAALPYYDRDRTFEGYRGFGIARMADMVVDDHAVTSDAPSDLRSDTGEAVETVAADDVAYDDLVDDDGDDPLNGEPPVLHSATITPFRRERDLDAVRAEAANGDTAVERTSDELPRDDVVIKPLSDSENEAFDRIREELRPVAQTSNDTVDTGSAAMGVGVGVGDEDAFDRDFNGDQQSVPSYGLGPETLDALPLPLLIVRGEDALYANPAFADLTGHGDVTSVNAQGLSALFGATSDVAAQGDGAIQLVSKDGAALSVRSHLQRVPWMGRNALMFAFERADRVQTSPTYPTVDDPEALPLRITHEADEQVEHLVEENAELRAILDTATDGVVTIDEAGDIRSMNSAATALFGYDTDALIGQSFSILFAHESQKQVLDYVQSMGSNGVANVLNEGREVTGREAKGGEIKLFMTLGRLAVSKGFCAVLRDITSWKRSEQALETARLEAESASEMKSAFLAKVSHEIRTPLNAIIGFSEIMGEERFGPIGNERYRDYLDDIKKSGRYVVDLVNDLLDISKIESGNQELQFESVSLNDTVSDVIDMLRPQANRGRIIVRAGLDPDLPEIVADQRSAKQIVTNLLSNALRYTQEGGQVVVSTRYQKDGSVTLRIRDSGVGMTAEELQGALRPFKQVSVDEDMRAAGTGLGLPLTRALVEANRAAFEIKSAPGEGTDVEVSFPAPRVLTR
ncbi:MAG: PAS domain S-box protein, partial [Pseudomonadota bacterium]